MNWEEALEAYNCSPHEIDHGQISYTDWDEWQHLQGVGSCPRCGGGVLVAPREDQNGRDYLNVEPFVSQQQDDGLHCPAQGRLYFDLNTDPSTFRALIHARCLHAHGQTIAPLGPRSRLSPLAE